MNEIAEASKRISALLAGAKQYSQMDRGSYQSADVHELLRSTIMMFGDKVGKARTGRSPWSRTWTRRCPKLQCYPGDLNQVWTNIIDNAIQAMDGHGTLTHADGAGRDEQKIRVEICDDGPGIPEEIVGPHLHPVLHHQAVRRGHRPRAGSGLADRDGEARRQHVGAVQAGRYPVHRRACRWRHLRPRRHAGRDHRRRLGIPSRLIETE